jgi:chromosome segregation ATPase
LRRNARTFSLLTALDEKVRRALAPIVRPSVFSTHSQLDQRLQRLEEELAATKEEKEHCERRLEDSEAKADDLHRLNTELNGLVWRNNRPLPMCHLSTLMDGCNPV